MGFFNRLKQNFPKDWPTRIILPLLFILSLVGAYFGHQMVRRLVGSTTAFTLPGDPLLPQGDAETVDSTPTPDLAADLPAPDPWDGASRVNLLVMGLDLREGETVEDDAPRSETMILLSLWTL